MIAWFLLSGAISLLGNLVVLLATTVFRAIKLDKVAVVLITNLAVADLGMSLTAILPSVGSTVARRWIYGDLLCSVSNYLESVLAAASIGLTCALSVTKLTSLLFPFKARTRTKRTGYLIAGGIWSLAVLPITPDIFLPRETSFNEMIFRCDTSEVKEVDMWLGPLKSTILCFIPFVIVTVCTIWLIFFVHKVRGIQKQSVVTAILISAVFLVSFLPVGILMLLGNRFNSNNSMHLILLKLALCSPFMHFMANPLIYLVSITSFRNFFACRSPKLRTIKLKKQCSVTYGLSHTRGVSEGENTLERDVVRLGSLVTLQRSQSVITDS